MTGILVAIQCLVYNHEPYLRQCLDGFVIQKTDFRFVAIVHDDASTDGSAAIIREYAEKYPEIIKPIYETENQYSKADGSLSMIMDRAIDDTGAKYVALCEGDDYWTDAEKLQMQVAFLEDHPDYSMCFHAAEVLHQGVDSELKFDVKDADYNSTEVFGRWTVPTASIVYRKCMVQSYRIKKSGWITRGDIILVLKCTHTGKVRGMSKYMSVYRMQPNSVSYNPCYHDAEILKLPLHFKCILYNFPEVDKELVRWCISASFYSKMKRDGCLLVSLFDFIQFLCWHPRFASQKIRLLIRRILLPSKAGLC